MANLSKPSCREAYQIEGDTILQWNIRGIGANYEQLKILISDFNPICICLQETKTSFDKLPTIKGYELIKQMANAEGIAIYVKNGTPFSPFTINTSLRVSAIKVTIQNKPTVVCSIHIPPKHNLTEDEIQDVYSQIRMPCLLLGDYNGHSPLWGNGLDVNGKGKIIEKFLLNNNLCIFNDKSITYISDSNKCQSSLDLSICTPDIFLDFEWIRHEDTCGSDHFPIIIATAGKSKPTGIPRYCLNKADWKKFELGWTDINIEEIISDPDPIEAFTKVLHSIADSAIPKSKGKGKRPRNSWYNEECKEANDRRVKALKAFLKSPNPETFSGMKCRRAGARRITKTCKRSSWRSFVSTITRKTQAKRIWNMIRSINGKRASSPVYHLKTEDGMAETHEEIVEALADNYVKQSSVENHSDTFQSTKAIEERKDLNFKSKNQESYNRKFTLKDLRKSIKKAKNSSEGPDKIHYELLKHLPTCALQLLLDIYNKIWTEGPFPDVWRLATIIPIPKPDKDLSLPASYRPISLTSCVCKTMERMVNTRLVWYLEKNGFISRFQCGFRKDRSTTDHLLRLENYIRQAFKNGEQCVSVFFDLEKAYDTTWKYGILRDLHESGIRGHMASFIQGFLDNRKFQVRVGNTYSTMKELEMGVPQGSILSVTLFVLKINKLAEIIDDDVLRSLFVDDFQICYRSMTMNLVERHIQDNLDKISEWATKNGFKFSFEKTVCVHFWKHKSTRPPKLVIKVPDGPPTKRNKAIKSVAKTKFLGLIWDRKLTFENHILYLRGKCLKAINMLKVLSHTDWGADTHTLLKLYRSQIRSKLDYGCVVYSSASHTQLEKLYSIQNEALRICCGAFKSSYVESLHAECFEMPLKLRHLQISMQYAIKLRANRNNPAYEHVFLHDNALYDCLSDLPSSDDDVESEVDEISNKPEKRPNLKPLFNERIREFVEEAAIPFDDIAQNKIPPVEPWLLTVPKIDYSLSLYTKADTNPTAYLSDFKQVCELYKDHTHIYTDGSKKDEKAGGAATWDFGELQTRIPDGASTFSAEAVALIDALKMVRDSLRKRFIIFTDSLSCLQSIENEDLSNSLILEFLLKYRDVHLKKKIVVLCWIPSHIGIPGNEQADRLAKESLELDIRPIPIPYTDFYSIPKKYCMKIWQDCWDTQLQHLTFISPQLTRKSYDSSLSRREERALCRLRIGHTRLTHSFRMEGKEDRPKCETCQVFLTVRHIMTECLDYQALREALLPGDTLEEIFSNSDRSIVTFLRECDLLNKL